MKIPKYESGGALQINGETGETEAIVKGGERIFSIADTKKIVRAAGTARDEKDFEALGELIRKCIKVQDNTKQEFTK